jgi:hypothetical protein
VIHCGEIHEKLSVGMEVAKVSPSIDWPAAGGNQPQILALGLTVIEVADLCLNAEPAQEQRAMIKVQVSPHRSAFHPLREHLSVVIGETDANSDRPAVLCGTRPNLGNQRKGGREEEHCKNKLHVHVISPFTVQTTSGEANLLLVFV